MIKLLAHWAGHGHRICLSLVPDLVTCPPLVLYCSLILFAWFRPQNWRLAAHVLSAASDHHPLCLYLFCDVTGTQADGKQETVWSEEGPRDLQLQRRGSLYIYVLWGQWSAGHIHFSAERFSTELRVMSNTTLLLPSWSLACKWHPPLTW